MNESKDPQLDPIDGDQRRELILAYLDGELDAADEARLGEWLRSQTGPLSGPFSDERELVEEYRDVELLIRRWEANRIPPDARSPESALFRIRTHLRARKRRRTLKAVAVAAILLIGCSGLWTYFSDGPNAEDRSIIQNLDLLETLEDESGGELSIEFVDQILEEVADLDTLDTRLFDYVLEEELLAENL